MEGSGRIHGREADPRASSGGKASRNEASPRASRLPKAQLAADLDVGLFPLSSGLMPESGRIEAIRAARTALRPFLAKPRSSPRPPGARRIRYFAAMAASLAGRRAAPRHSEKKRPHGARKAFQGLSRAMERCGGLGMKAGPAPSLGWGSGLRGAPGAVEPCGSVSRGQGLQKSVVREVVLGA
jgi:hypothetical protein